MMTMQPKRVVIDIQRHIKDYINPDLPPNTDDNGKPTNKIAKLTRGIQITPDVEGAEQADGNPA